MLCTTHSISSSAAFRVALVRVREHHGLSARRRRVIPCLDSAWRRLQSALRTTPATSRANGIDRPANRDGEFSAVNVRHDHAWPLSPELILLGLQSLRWTC